MKDLEIKFSLSDDCYLTALRLAVGAVGALADLDVDGVEDMKVCVTESCLILKGCGFEGVKIVLSGKQGFCAEVSGEGGELAAFDNGFSLALISALVSSCDIDEKDGIISRVKLKL